MNRCFRCGKKIQEGYTLCPECVERNHGMTREEAIEILKQFKKCLSDVVFDEKGSEAWQMAIQALSQEPICDRDCEHCTWTECPIEPCEDAISREDAIKAQCEACDICGNMRYTKCQYFMQGCNEVKCLRDLPSVTQKSGKWIYDRTIENWRCTECDKPPKIRGYVGTLEFMVEHFKFCPNCGADMREPQESEDKE